MIFVINLIIMTDFMTSNIFYFLTAMRTILILLQIKKASHNKHLIYPRTNELDVMIRRLLWWTSCPYRNKTDLINGSNKKLTFD